MKEGQQDTEQHVMSQGWGKKRRGQGVSGDTQGILCKLRNFVVSKAKCLCVCLANKIYMCLFLLYS